MKDEQFKDSWSRYRGFVTDFKAASKEAQRAWIAYRDRWADLAAVLYKDDKPPRGDPVVSVKTRLTRQRTAELETDPLGP